MSERESRPVVPGWWMRVIAVPAAWSLRMMSGMRRRRWVGRRRLDRLRQAREPVVLATWHGCSLLLAAALRETAATVLVSDSRDGAWATAILEALGYSVVRGSSSRAGARGLLAMFRASGADTTTAITVDGPRGPEGTVAPGVVWLAQMGGLWVVPVAAACKPGWRLPTRDRTQVPAPWAKVGVFVGRPVRIGVGRDSRRAAVVRLEARLRSLHRRADRLLGSARSFEQPSVEPEGQRRREREPEEAVGQEVGAGGEP